MNGLLVVDKPAGITSHGVVARCRRVLGERKIGHAGTLDPSATGVLVLGVGRATRLLQFLEATDKTYRATFMLGVQTSTLDADGEVTATTDASGITAADVEEVLPRFRGAIAQVPPMVSAIKVGGEPLYRKARRGETLDRPPRAVTIQELALESFDPPTVRVRCSKGTYIRSLVADIGDALGVGAHVTTLRRTASGSLKEDDAVPLDQVDASSLRPIEHAVAGLPAREIDAATATALIHGKRIDAAGIDGPYAAMLGGHVVGVLRDDGGAARSVCIVADAAEVGA